MKYVKNWFLKVSLFQTGQLAPLRPGSPTAPAVAPAPVTLGQFADYWNSTLRKYAEPNARVFEVGGGVHKLS
jgi:hypothetical protein